MSSRPLVSVVIDTYNHERYIETAILSVLQQDFAESDVDILVVDDGSTDGSPELIRKFGGRVRYLRKANGGQASAFNLAIPKARGDLVAFLDGDDWWDPGKLRAVAGVFAESADIDAVGHGIVIVHRDGRMEHEEPRQAVRLHLDSVETACAFRVRKSFLGTSRFAARRALLDQILPIPEALTIEADEYVFTMAALLGNVLILPETLTYYRLHAGNLFQFGDADVSAVRRKYRVLSDLASHLSHQFRARSVPKEVASAVVEAVQTEADLTRLNLEGGLPWETVFAELRWDHILNPVAPFRHRASKFLSLLPALFLPPRWYYHLRRRLVTSGSYQRWRSKWLPPSQRNHVVRSVQPGK